MARKKSEPRPPPPPPPEPKDREIDSKISGVSFKNPNGTSRQELIRTYCKPGLMLWCHREPDNPHDPNAVGVFVKVGSKHGQVGYLTSRVAPDAARHIDAGRDIEVHINEITGGGRGESLGVNVTISLLARPAIFDAELVEDPPPRAPSRPAKKSLSIVDLFGWSVGIVLVFVPAIFLVLAIATAAWPEPGRLDATDQQTFQASIRKMAAPMSLSERKVFQADVTLLMFSRGLSDLIGSGFEKKVDGMPIRELYAEAHGLTAAAIHIKAEAIRSKQRELGRPGS